MRGVGHLVVDDDGAHVLVVASHHDPTENEYKDVTKSSWD